MAVGTGLRDRSRGALGNPRAPGCDMVRRHAARADVRASDAGHRGDRPHLHRRTDVGVRRAPRHAVRDGQAPDHRQRDDAGHGELGQRSSPLCGRGWDGRARRICASGRRGPRAAAHRFDRHGALFAGRSLGEPGSDVGHGPDHAVHSGKAAHLGLRRGRHALHGGFGHQLQHRLEYVARPHGRSPRAEDGPPGRRVLHVERSVDQRHHRHRDDDHARPRAIVGSRLAEGRTVQRAWRDLHAEHGAWPGPGRQARSERDHIVARHRGAWPAAVGPPVRSRDREDGEREGCAHAAVRRFRGGRDRQSLSGQRHVDPRRDAQPRRRGHRRDDGVDDLSIQLSGRGTGRGVRNGVQLSGKRRTRSSIRTGCRTSPRSRRASRTTAPAST